MGMWGPLAQPVFPFPGRKDLGHAAQVDVATRQCFSLTPNQPSVNNPRHDMASRTGCT